MSENVALAREAYDAYNREGITGILVYLDPEVEWRNPVQSPNAGVFVGHEGVLQWQAMVDDAFKEMHFEPDSIDELPDGRVLALVRFRFRAPTGGLHVSMTGGRAVALDEARSRGPTLRRRSLTPGHGLRGCLRSSAPRALLLPLVADRAPKAQRGQFIGSDNCVQPDGPTLAQALLALTY